jgi:hypothetical protein
VPHFHAYAYTGRGFSDAEIRRGLPPSGYPPIMVREPRGEPGLRLDSLHDAMSWLEQELLDQVPLDAESFPVAVRLDYSRSRLQQERAPEVIYGYWSRSGHYVSRCLFPCVCNSPG